MNKQRKAYTLSTKARLKSIAATILIMLVFMCGACNQHSNVKDSYNEDDIDVLTVDDPTSEIMAMVTSGEHIGVIVTQKFNGSRRAVDKIIAIFSDGTTKVVPSTSTALTTTTDTYAISNKLLAVGTLGTAGGADDEIIAAINEFLNQYNQQIQEWVENDQRIPAFIRKQLVDELKTYQDELPENENRYFSPNAIKCVNGEWLNCYKAFRILLGKRHSFPQLGEDEVFSEPTYDPLPYEYGEGFENIQMWDKENKSRRTVIGLKPVAKITPPPVSALFVDESGSFHGDESSDPAHPDEQVGNYYWEAWLPGDAEYRPLTYGGDTITLDFSKPGSYRVKLTVTSRSTHLRGSDFKVVDVTEWEESPEPTGKSSCTDPARGVCTEFVAGTESAFKEDCEKNGLNYSSSSGCGFTGQYQCTNARTTNYGVDQTVNVYWPDGYCDKYMVDFETTCDQINGTGTGVPCGPR